MNSDGSVVGVRVETCWQVFHLLFREVLFLGAVCGAVGSLFLTGS